MQTTAPRHASVSRLSPSMRRQESIEWEDLPSFANTLTNRLVTLGTRQGDPAAPVWVETVVAEIDLDLSPPSEPFRETLEGLQTREVHEPEVFRVFFGELAATN
jgi:hypothetical protein